MRKWVYLVALLLTLTLGPTGQTQVKLIAPKATTEKALALQTESIALNTVMQRYNEVLLEAGGWVDVPPEKALPLVQEIEKRWHKISEIYLHYREVEP